MPLAGPRQNAVAFSSLWNCKPMARFHQANAGSRWVWLPRIRANQTFTSGKLNELINVFVGEIERLPAGCWDKWRIQTEPAFPMLRFRFLHNALDTPQDELPRGRAFPCGGFVQAAMKIGWDVERSADGPLSHGFIVPDWT